MTRRRYAFSTVFEECVLESLFWLPRLLVLILEILELHLHACCPAPSLTANSHYGMVFGWRRGGRHGGKEASVFIIEERLTQESNPLSGQLVVPETLYLRNISAV